MVDNFDLVKLLLKFSNDDEFYQLEILQRKKENPDLGSNSRKVKTYQIRSVEHLEKYEEEIKAICNVTNARAMIRANRRSWKTCAFKTLEKMAGAMSNGHWWKIGEQHSKAIGKGHIDPRKLWIVDIDPDNSGNNVETLLDMAMIKINDLHNHNRVELVIPSAVGYHIITRPFWVDKFREAGFTHDIQKDNPTNLYIP